MVAWNKIPKDMHVVKMSKDILRQKDSMSLTIFFLLRYMFSGMCNGTFNFFFISRKSDLLSISKISLPAS